MNNQKKILIPTDDAESWRLFLADPNKHWKNGYSAKCIAESWEKFGDFPKEIKAIIQNEESLKDSELLLAIPEFKVNLPGGNRPSQNDLLFIASNKKGLAVCTVEAKAKEDFDLKMADWLANSSVGKRERIQYILKKINFPKISSECFENLRYQLFHRLASAVTMAEKFHAQNAIMIIQSFVENDQENHFGDFQAFVGAYTNEKIEKEKFYKLTPINNTQVLVGWVFSKE